MMRAINPQTKMNVQLKFPGILKANSGVLAVRNDMPPYFEKAEDSNIANPENMMTNCSLSVRTIAENPPVAA